jgi:hypothetical protein
LPAARQQKVESNVRERRNFMGLKEKPEVKGKYLP